ncbi:MAG: tetratricopeptide repeat protein, partial [Planctomycetaceae bacterium]
FYAAPAADGWTQLAAAKTAEDYENLAESDAFADSPVAAWAQLLAAERHLEDGLEETFSDMKAAVGTLELAEEGFATLIETEDVPPEIRERALYGHATTLEILSEKNTKPAVEAYETLLDEFPQSLYAETAKERIDALQTKSARDFYVWFHDENRRPADLDRPNDGSPTTGGFPMDHPLPPSLDIPERLRLPEPAAVQQPSESTPPPPHPPGFVSEPETPATPESPTNDNP